MRLGGNPTPSCRSYQEAILESRRIWLDVIGSLAICDPVVVYSLNRVKDCLRRPMSHPLAGFGFEMVLEAQPSEVNYMIGIFLSTFQLPIIRDNS